MAQVAHQRPQMAFAGRPCRQIHLLQERQQRTLTVRAEPETSTPSPGAELENPDSEVARKMAEATRLRSAEKFMVIGAGKATCKGCGYEYTPDKGDPDFPVARGTTFESLPADYFCPICGAPKDKFESSLKVVAGFAENQKYGLGTNSMTGGQKLGIIYGSLALFFLLFILGYALE